MVRWRDVVEQPARRGDHDLRAAAQGVDLAVEADAAVDGGRADRGWRRRTRTLSSTWSASSRVGARISARMRRWPAVARVACEALEHGQDERGGLAGAGLGAGQEVATGEDERDRLTLDGGGLGVALCRDGTEQLGRKPECSEGHGVKAPDEALPRNRGARSGRGLNRDRGGG